MTEGLELLSGRSCRSCIRRHVGPAVETTAPLGVFANCGGCGELRVVYRFTYWFPWPDAPDWHPSMGSACQCPEVSFTHSARRCPHDGSIRVARAGVELLVCDHCVISGDVRLDTCCEDCGEEAGNHAADCPCWGEGDDPTTGVEHQEER